MDKKRNKVKIKAVKIAGFLGIISTILGLIGAILCCNIVFITLFGAGIILTLSQYNIYLIGIGIILVLSSMILLFFGKKKCLIKK